MGAYLFGTFMVFVCVIVHHLHVAINIRDWNLPYTLMTIVSIGFLPLIVWANNRIDSAVTFRSIGYIMSQPMMWGMTFFTISACTLPLYAASRI